MVKTRAMPVLASAAIALSLSACQWMGMDQQGGGAGQQTGQASQQRGYPATSGGQAAMAEQQQALAPDLVRDVQRSLGQRGFDVGPIDGVYGESTAAALRNFQQTQGLRPTGQLDRQTMAALGIAASGQRAETTQQQRQQDYTPTTRRGAMDQGGMQQQQRQQAALPPDMLRDVQQELQDRGYRVGRVDGMWGPNTQQAVRNFQRDQELQTSGRLDQETLAALGVEGTGAQTGQLPEAERDPEARRDSPGRSETTEPEIDPAE